MPAAIVSAGPKFHHESMPAEVAMLHPTSHGPAALIDELVDDPSRYLAGIVLFNRGDYFEAHEVLEHLWLVCAGPDKKF